MSTYTIKTVPPSASYEVQLDLYAWFEVFRSGQYAGTALEYFEPVGDPSKRVTFAENLPHEPA